MRRSDRETEPEKVLDECECIRLGLTDEFGAYIVPMNFGKCTEQGKTVLYMHSAKCGKKIDIIRENGRVSFQADCGHGLKAGNSACEYGFFYKSVFGHGTAELVQDAEEKVFALNMLMKKYTGRADRQFENTDAVEVIKLTVTDMSGKAHI